MCIRDRSDIETEQEEKDGSGETETDVISIDGDQLKVMASFYPMYDFAQKIGGDRVEVTNMVPAGTEPVSYTHLRMPKPQSRRLPRKMIKPSRSRLNTSVRNVTAET